MVSRSLVFLTASGGVQVRGGRGSCAERAKSGKGKTGGALDGCDCTTRQNRQGTRHWIMPPPPHRPPLTAPPLTGPLSPKWTSCSAPWA